jgi:hypothetical protein
MAAAEQHRAPNQKVAEAASPAVRAASPAVGAASPAVGAASPAGQAQMVADA